MGKAIDGGEDRAIDMQPSPITEAQLGELVARGTEAFRRGDLDLALRCIDRVWRYAPDNFLIAEFLSRLLMARGHDRAARRHFESLTARWPSPEAEANLVRLMLEQDPADRARERLAGALRRFCVTPGSGLADVAEQILVASPESLCGWIGLDPSLGVVGGIKGLRAGQRVQIAADNDIVLDIAPTSSGDGLAALRARLPSGTSGAELSLWAEGQLLCGGLAFPPAFEVDGRSWFEAGRMVGWASLAWSPDRPVEIVAEDERGTRVRVATERDADLPFRWRFALEPGDIRGERIVTSVALPDGRWAPLPDAPFLHLPAPAPAPSRRRLPRRRAAARAGKTPRRIDVIVPVYRGLEETRACLDAALATLGNEADVIVVDDASPEPALVAYIDALAHARRITLLRNETNAGFPASCNRGMALHRDRDVVLLNADAVVHGDWLRRLTTAAYSAPDIATVTPFSNAGSIVSYPAGEEQDCDPQTGVALDDLAAALHRDRVVDLPVGVGFCLYLRRDCLDEVGPFDAATFSSGYGEEVDFCLRAAARGWRHVLAPNVFVRHEGGRSFGSRRAALLDRSSRLINQRYPFFPRLVEDFHAAQPLAPLRRALDEARLKAARRRHVVMATLALPGGVERFVRERGEAALENGVVPLVLKPALEDFSVCVLETPASGSQDLRYALPAEADQLWRLLSELDIAHVEIHHFLDHDPDLAERLLELERPVDIYIHDYSWICPRITLIDDTQRYCGEPKLAACEACIRKSGARIEKPRTVRALRKRSHAWLRAARHIFVPTEDVARRLARYFPDAKVEISPWEEVVPASAMREEREPRAVTRVAVVGAIGVHKGYEILCACVRDAEARALPLEFVVLGYTADDEELRNCGNVFVTGRYDDNELAELLAREAPDVVFCPSVWPEVWCYALTPAIRAGLPILAFDLGAMKERLADYSQGVMVPLTDDPAFLNNRLLNLGQQIGDKANNGEDAPAQRSLLSAGRTLNIARSSRSDLMPALNTVTATVQILPVANGLYSFTVSEGSPDRAAALDNLLLPAVHVGLGPGVSSDHVEFLAGPSTHGSWLCQVGDTVIAKVTAPVTLLLTSLQSTTGQALGIEVERLDSRKTSAKEGEVHTGPAPLGPVPMAAVPFEASPRVAAPVVAAAASQPMSTDAQAVGLDIKLHIRNVGDASFSDADWAGRRGLGQWIEAFTILPREHADIFDLQYKGLSATGTETPWLTNGVECGTRGKSTPLLGFAVRLKANDAAARYVCEYSGYFSSGTVIGPLRNGTPCRSNLKNDPLEGLRIQIKERKNAQMAQPQRVAQVPSGPRFSRLREDDVEAPAKRERVRAARRPALPPDANQAGPARMREFDATDTAAEAPLFNAIKPALHAKPARGVRPAAHMHGGSNPPPHPESTVRSRPGTGPGRKE